VHRGGAGRVRAGGLDAAPRGAGTPGDHRLGVGADFLELFDEGPAADDAEHAVFVQRRIAFDGDDVIALISVPDLVQDRFGLMAGRGHDRVVVIQADHGQHHVLDQGMGRADEAFGAAGAFQPVQPQHGDARLVSMAWAMRGAKDGPRPSEAAVREQNLRKLRRLIP
jgi:hypothetical protein